MTLHAPVRCIDCPRQTGRAALFITAICRDYGIFTFFSHATDMWFLCFFDPESAGLIALDMHLIDGSFG